MSQGFVNNSGIALPVSIANGGSGNKVGGVDGNGYITVTAYYI